MLKRGETLPNIWIIWLLKYWILYVLCQLYMLYVFIWFLFSFSDIPNVNIPDNYYAVEISNNVVIPCNINSNPNHFSVTWQRRNNNGAINNLDVSDQTQYNNGNIGTPALTILNAQNADEGYYICTATNAVGTGSSSLTYIDVTGSKYHINFLYIVLLNDLLIDWLIDWCLMPTLSVFQPFCGVDWIVNKCLLF